MLTAWYIDSFATQLLIRLMWSDMLGDDPFTPLITHDTLCNQMHAKSCHQGILDTLQLQKLLAIGSDSIPALI